MLDKNEKVEKFNKQTKGTILWLLQKIGVIPTLLTLIGLFLPLFKIEIINETIGIFDYLEQELPIIDVWLYMFMIGVLPTLFFDEIKKMIINEKINKNTGGVCLVLIAIIVFILTIVFASLNLPVSLVAKNLETNEKLVSAGIGCIFFYIGSICYSIITLMESGLLFAVFTGKTKVENLEKIVIVLQKTEEK